MMIGGSDLVLEVPPRVPAAELIIARMRHFWPEALFQDAESDVAHPIQDPWTGLYGSASREFFIYRDRPSFESWQAEGGTDENLDRMLSFLIGNDAAAGSPGQVTVVCGEQTPAVRRLIEDLQGSFRAYQAPRQAA
jgi:hypothetical protein